MIDHDELVQAAVDAFYGDPSWHVANADGLCARMRAALDAAEHARDDQARDGLFKAVEQALAEWLRKNAELKLLGRRVLTVEGGEPIYTTLARALAKVSLRAVRRVHWRPIETIPREWYDGRLLLAVLNDPTPGYRTQCVVRWDGQWFSVPGSWPKTPTHLAQLPALPLGTPR